MRIDASDSFESALRRLVLRWLRKVGSLQRAASQGDIEAVHDMRTGIRRLRTLLGLAEGKRARRLRKCAKRVGLRLGAVRDLDVALARLNESVHRGELFLDDGVSAFKAAMRTERKEALRMLRRSLRTSGTRRWFRQVRAWTERKSHGPQVLEALPLALEQVAREVDSLGYAEDKTGKHGLRKALKRLRYVLEMFKAALPPSVSEIAEAAHAGQAALGEGRDRQALAERAAQEAEACLLMGKDARELLSYARRLREEFRSEDVVKLAIERAAEMALYAGCDILPWGTEGLKE